MRRGHAGRVTVYRSGAADHMEDLRAYVSAGAPVGLGVPKLRPDVVRVLAAYNAAGGRCFLDTGEFQAFGKGGGVNFLRVFAAYDFVLESVSSPGLVALVMPDKMGDQAATLELASRYRRQALRCIEAGADCIFPLHKGALSLADAYRDLVGRLDTDRFRVGLPSNKVRVEREELAAFVAEARPARIHLLGISEANRRFAPLVEAARRPSAALDISADAMRIRGMLSRSRSGVLARRIEERVNNLYNAEDGCYGQTDALGDLYNIPRLLNRREALELARAVTDDPAGQVEIVRAALDGDDGEEHGSRLGDLLDGEYFYEAQAAVPAFLKERIRLERGRDIRSEEIVRAEEGGATASGLRRAA